MRKPMLSNRSLSQNPDSCIAGCDMEPIASDIAASRVAVHETIWLMAHQLVVDTHLCYKSSYISYYARTCMTVLSIRLPEGLDARLNEESRLAGQPKSFIARTALEQFLAGRRRERFLARLSRAAAAVDAGKAGELADEALPFDNEALELAERGAANND